MNILVTGGTGYIGSVAVKILQEKGHSVSVLDNLSNSSRDSIAPDIPFFEGDFGNFDTVVPTDIHFDAVVHLGGLISAGESMHEPDTYWENNTLQTNKLLRAMRKRLIKNLIFASTAAVYGNPSEIPVTELSVTAPTNIYGATKLAADAAIGVETAASNLAAISLRFFNVAGAYKGAGERHPSETHLIPLALEAAAGKRSELTLFGTNYDTKDGSCVRDYVHVADLGYAIELALHHLQPGKHAIYNLGNGNGFTNKEVLKTVQNVTGATFTIKEEDPRTGDSAILIASSEKAKNELGWQPTKPGLDEIIKDAWEFYKATL